MAFSRIFRTASKWLTQASDQKKASPRPSSRLGLESLEERALPTTVSIVDPGFEMPALALGNFSYNPTGSAWAYTGNAGVSTNGSGFTSANPAAPQGGQVAFLQTQGSISQTAYFAAGTYDISFAAAQRTGQVSKQTFQVLVDGAVVGTFNNVAGNGYTSQFTSSFNLAEGNHTITFQGTNLNGGDNTIFLDQFSVNKLAASLGDSGFEQLALATGAYSYNPTGSAWAFTGNSGVTSNGSGFTVINPNAPQAGQVAFLQSQGSISQSVYFNAGTYDLTFAAAQRSGQAGAQTFQVLVDGTVVGTFNHLYGNAYRPVNTSTFTVSAGNHTVTFQGTNLYGGDNTVFLDLIYVTQLPNGLTDSGFEMSTLAAGAFVYNPINSVWGFSGTSGVTSNGSAFTAANPYTPQASQAAFLQSQGSISQIAYFDAGTYEISFAAAQRNGQVSKQTFQVLVDGTVVGTFNNLAGNAYSQLSTSSFNLTAGNHTITFQGTNLNGGDNTVFLDQVYVVKQATGLSDSGFELLSLTSGAYSYNPTGSAWTFTGTTGVTSNGSGFTIANPSAPQAGQVAFLQSQGSISQTAYFDAGTYEISFTAAQRSGQLSRQTFQVLVDGTVVGTFNNVTGNAYTSLTTSSFNLAAGNHTVTFQGTNLYGGDNTVFLDQITVDLRPSSLSDSGFEMPAVAAGSFSYIPTGSPWAFSSTTGITSNGSGFTVGNPNAPQAGQVAFLQTQGVISQTAYFDEGTYNLTFAASQRAGQVSTQTFQVLIDGTIVGTFNNLAGTTYTQLTTSSFTLAAGNHTVTFQGTNLNGGDNTVFLDQVNVTSL